MQNADIEDNISVFKKADEDNTKLPTFMVLKLDRLPRNDPRKKNVFSLIGRLPAVIEKELSTVKEDVIDLKPAAQQQATTQQ